MIPLVTISSKWVLILGDKVKSLRLFEGKRWVNFASNTVLQSPWWVYQTWHLLVMFTCTPLRPLFTFPSTGPPLSFEASTTSRPDEENKACSTLARLWHNPWAGGKQKDSRDKRAVGGGRWFWQKAEGRELRGPLLPPATLHHQAARDGWIEARPNNRSDSDTEWNH